MSIKHRLAAVAAAISLASIIATGAHADPSRLRGKVASFDGSTLTVDTREGKSEAVKLNKDWKVSSVAKASIEDIKTGDYVGIASLAKADGGDGALEVLIFPAAMKGAGEGSHPWDLKPNSTMTNATVADAVTEVDGRTLTLTYGSGQTKKIAVPANTPIVTFASANQADLVPGAAVFVVADQSGDGTYSSSRVVVGTKGVVPPM